MDNIQSDYESDEERNHITNTGAPTGDSQSQAGIPMISSLKERLAQAQNHPADVLPAAAASHLHTLHTNIPASLPSQTVFSSPIPPLIPTTIPTQVTRDLPQPAIPPSFPHITTSGIPIYNLPQLITTTAGIPPLPVSNTPLILGSLPYTMPLLAVDIHRPYRPTALLTQSKFTPRIAQAEILRKLKMPSTVGKYDGTIDPDDHINVFISAGGVERWALHEWCHIRDGESVEDFITRYNKESLQIAGAGEDLMIAGFIQGIRHDELIRRLHGRDGLPKTMEKLMTAARAFVRAERSVRSTHEYDKKDQRSDRTGKQPHSSRQTQRFRGPSTWTRPLSYTRPEPVRSVNTSTRFKDNPESRGVAWINKLVKSPREFLLTEK
ncbi:hypothetical protein L1987_77591 [Smallanthus sonchifolius]|uniref:Uncharacterized protein n=1 Tax=Smallanthus sonchifolius TaxID=185202 RepID=A0ACB8ZB99_9ASTR|nr:hypothetical protein L1987_77591 [Smallanthus sonchifolius]